MTPRGALWRLSVAAVVAALLLLALINAITNPVEGDTTSYTADFTDVSGLHEGADVRIRGVQVGKVESVDLRRVDGHSLGVVTFTLQDNYRPDDDTHLAIKYQALTGVRYVDVEGAENGPDSTATVDHIPTARTLPSFDITTLFNGLQPVLNTLSPDELNKFTENAVSLLQGDGTGLGPMLDSIRKLTDFVSDRQAVVATLMRNLSSVADALGGNSPQIVQVLEWLNRPLDAAIEVIDEFRKSQIYGPPFAAALTRLLDNLGIVRGLDIDRLLATAFASTSEAVETLRSMPAVLDGLSTPPADPQSGAPMSCTHGRAELPLPVQVLLNGQKVTLCNP
jgi:phospholipid/cholesterol/gamma-HCH transport system substrate-binding protein